MSQYFPLGGKNFSLFSAASHPGKALKGGYRLWNAHSTSFTQVWNPYC
jgi:hypothetical protein